MSPNPNPDTGPGHSKPPQGESEARDDLRDRLADAIRSAVRISVGPRALAELTAGKSIAISGGEADDAALAVLPVVEAETGALTHLLRKTEDELHHARTRAEQAEELLRIAHGTSNTAEAERARAVQRAERAEYDRDSQQRLAIKAGVERDEQKARAEKAEAAVQRVRDLAEDRIAVPSHVLLAVLDQPEATP